MDLEKLDISAEELLDNFNNNNIDDFKNTGDIPEPNKLTSEERIEKYKKAIANAQDQDDENNELGLYGRKVKNREAQTGIDYNSEYGEVGGSLMATAESVVPFLGHVYNSYSSTINQRFVNAVKTGEEVGNAPFFNVNIPFIKNEFADNVENWDNTEGKLYDVADDIVKGNVNVVDSNGNIKLPEGCEGLYEYRMNEKGRYERTGNLNKKYLESKDENRRKYIKELAYDVLSDRDDVKSKAAEALEKDTSHWVVQGVSIVSDQLSLMGEMIIGGEVMRFGAGSGMLGDTAKVLAEGKAAQLLTKGKKIEDIKKSIEAAKAVKTFPKIAYVAGEITTPSIASAFERYSALRADDITINEKGEIEIENERDSVGRALGYSIVGAYAEMGIEAAGGLLTGNILRGTFNNLIKPQIKGAMIAHPKFGQLFTRTDTDGFVKRTIFDTMKNCALFYEKAKVPAAKYGGFIGEGEEEYNQGFVDNVVGLGRKKSEGRQSFVDFNREFFSSENTRDLTFSILGLSAVTGGMGYSANKVQEHLHNSFITNIKKGVLSSMQMTEQEFNNLKPKERDAVITSFVGSENAKNLGINLTASQVLKNFGVSEEKLNAMSETEKVKNAFIFANMFTGCQTDEEIKTRAKQMLQMCNDNVRNAINEIVERNALLDTSVSTDMLNGDVQFTGVWEDVEDELDEDGNPQSSGIKAMRDTKYGVQILHLNTAAGSQFAIQSAENITNINGNRITMQARTMEQAIECAKRISRITQVLSQHREQKRTVLNKMISRLAPGSNVAVYDTIDDAINAEPNVANQKDFDRSNSAWRSKDGKMSFVLDNMSSPIEIINSILHENGVHNGLRAIFTNEQLNYFLENIDQKQFGNIVDNVRQLYGGNMKYIIEETLAHIYENRIAKPSLYNYTVHMIRNVGRAITNGRVKFNESDVEVIMAHAQKESMKHKIQTVQQKRNQQAQNQNPNNIPPQTPKYIPNAQFNEPSSQGIQAKPRAQKDVDISDGGNIYDGLEVSNREIERIKKNKEDEEYAEEMNLRMEEEDDEKRRVSDPKYLEEQKQKEIDKLKNDYDRTQNEIRSERSKITKNKRRITQLKAKNAKGVSVEENRKNIEEIRDLLSDNEILEDNIEQLKKTNKVTLEQLKSRGATVAKPPTEAQLKAREKFREKNKKTSLFNFVCQYEDLHGASAIGFWFFNKRSLFGGGDPRITKAYGCDAFVHATDGNPRLRQLLLGPRVKEGSVYKRKAHCNLDTALMEYFGRNGKYSGEGKETDDGGVLDLIDDLIKQYEEYQEFVRNDGKTKEQMYLEEQEAIEYEEYINAMESVNYEEQNALEAYENSIRNAVFVDSHGNSIDMNVLAENIQLNDGCGIIIDEKDFLNFYLADDSIVFSSTNGFDENITYFKVTENGWSEIKTFEYGSEEQKQYENNLKENAKEKIKDIRNEIENDTQAKNQNGRDSRLAKRERILGTLKTARAKQSDTKSGGITKGESSNGIGETISGNRVPKATAKPGQVVHVEQIDKNSKGFTGRFIKDNGDGTSTVRVKDVNKSNYYQQFYKDVVVPSDTVTSIDITNNYSYEQRRKNEENRIQSIKDEQLRVAQDEARERKALLDDDSSNDDEKLDDKGTPKPLNDTEEFREAYSFIASVFGNNANDESNNKNDDGNNVIFRKRDIEQSHSPIKLFRKRIVSAQNRTDKSENLKQIQISQMGNKICQDFFEANKDITDDISFDKFFNHCVNTFGQATIPYLESWYLNNSIMKSQLAKGKQATSRVEILEYLAEKGYGEKPNVVQPGSKDKPKSIVVRESLIPQPESSVQAEDFSKSYGFVLDDQQLLGVNLMLDRVLKTEKGAFLLADGTGFGKTAQLLAVIQKFHEAKPNAKILLVSENETVLKERFAQDARAMGINPSIYTAMTYTQLGKITTDNHDYDLAVFDEAHNFKNPDAKKSLGGARIRTPHKIFATATPMDKTVGAAYFLSEITGLSEEEVFDKVGIEKKIQQKWDWVDGKRQLVYEERIVPKQNVSWQKVFQNIHSMRDAAISLGAMIRREYPFYGTVDIHNAPLAEDYGKSISDIEGVYDAMLERANGAMARGKVNMARLQEVSKASEIAKIKQAFEIAQKEIADGRKVIIVAEGVNEQMFTARLPNTRSTTIINRNGYSVEKFIAQGALTQLKNLFEQNGISTSDIFGANKASKQLAVRDFQDDVNNVALLTPKSGGTGIDLDDQVGDKPRTMIILTSNFAGDLFQQILGRPSRKNTKSPTKVLILQNETSSDLRRHVILQNKLSTLKAIQGGADIDTAQGLDVDETGKEESHVSPEEATQDVRFRKRIAENAEQLNRIKEEMDKNSPLSEVINFRKKLNINTFDHINNAFDTNSLTDAERNIITNIAQENSSDVNEENRKVDRKALTDFRRIIQDHLIDVLNLENSLGYGEYNKGDSFYYTYDRNFGYDMDQNNQLRHNYINKIIKMLKDSKCTVQQLDDLLMAMAGPARNKMIFERTKKVLLGQITGVKNGSGQTTEYWNEEIKKMKDSGLYAKLEPIANLVWRMNNETLDRLVDSGRLSKIQANTWKKLSPFYIPFRTDIDEEDGSNRFVGEGRAYSKNEFHHALGRSSKADSPFVFSVIQASQAIHRANENLARIKLAHIVLTNPKIGRVLSENEIPHTQRYNKKTGKVEYIYDSSFKSKDNVIMFKEDGDLKFIELYDDKKEGLNGVKLGRAIKGNSLIQIPKWLTPIKTIARIFAVLRTTASPEFIFANYTQDTLEAYQTIYTRLGLEAANDFRKNLKNSRKAASRYENNKLNFSEYDNYAREWATNGGLIGGITMSSFKDTQEIIASQMESALDRLKKKNILGFAKKGVDSIYGLIAVANASVEMGVRISAYATCRKFGMDIADAVSFARDVTVNFNRKGEITPLTNNLYPFSNASIQDAHKSIGNFTVKQGKRGAKLATTLVVLGFLTSLLNNWFDDEDNEKEGLPQWKTTSDYAKQNKVCLSLGSSNKMITIPTRGYFRIPIYFGVCLGDSLCNGNYEENLKKYIEFLGGAIIDPFGGSNDVAQTITPGPFRFITELVENKSFTGSQIYREIPDRYSPRSNAGYISTSAVWHSMAKGLNKLTDGNEAKRGLIDVQPEKIKHTYEGIMASVGSDISRAISLPKDIINKSVEVRNIPFVRRFVSNKGDNSQSYYKSLDRYKEALNQEKYAKETDDFEMLKRIRSDEPFLGDYKTSSTLKSLDKEIKKLKKTENQTGDIKTRKELKTKRMKMQYEFIKTMKDSLDKSSHNKEVGDKKLIFKPKGK